MLPSDSTPRRLGTRASALARWQAEWVAARLRDAGVPVELVPIGTHGDADRAHPIGALGTAGVFTKELQRALLDGRIDLAVHSLKDLPTDAVDGLLLAAVPPRETVRDGLIARDGRRLADLPRGAVVGTGSLRRRAQLLHVRPDLVLGDVRGNVETRIRKLDEGAFDAIVLAEAGLVRLGLAHRITEVLSPEVMLPAVGQGALGIETRADDATTLAAVAPLDDAATHAAVLAERTLLAELRGGCLAPVAAWARAAGEGQLRLQAVVIGVDGRQRLAVDLLAEATAAVALGRRAAEQLLAQGAAALIAAARGDSP